MAIAIRPQPIGLSLRDWRERRELSQLDLAYMASVSTRHLSFIETGRSMPSRAMLVKLTQQLDIPLRERNDLLLAAGYAPVYRERNLDDAELAPIRGALDLVLKGHAPYPAFIFDRNYDAIALNDGVPLLLDGVADRLLTPTLNTIRVALHPEGLAPRIANLAAFRNYLLMRLRRDVARTGNTIVEELLDEVESYPGAPYDEPDPHETGDGIAVPLKLRTREGELTFYSAIATFGTAVDITVAELCIESFFPADDATAAAVRAAAARRDT